LPSEQKSTVPPQIIEARQMSADRMGFSYEMPPLMQDTTLLLTLLDADGIRSREPVRLALVAVPDTPPQLAVRLAGIGTAITARARLPILGQISDDYGIGRVWFEYAIDQQKSATRPVLAPRKHPTELPLDDVALEVGELGLKPGEKILVSLKAADLCKLGPEPNVGSSERWLLDVVSPEQLRAMLEARELVLRQRLEAIVQDVAETRDLLLRMEFATSGGSSTTSAPSATPGVQKPGAEPGEEAEEREDKSPARQLALRTLRVQQGMQNSRKSAQETLGVAEAVDDIRQQLVNNRIDTEELKQRLGSGIAEPLHRIGEDMFPELDRRLELLEQAVADQRLGPERNLLAQKQADDILLALHKVLGRMIELEDFNELVQSLRTIIKEQQRLDEETKQRHKQRIRELLEK
jgi:hypothetical protein